MKRLGSILLVLVLLPLGFLVWRAFFSWPVQTRAAIEAGDLKRLQRLVADPNAYLAVTKKHRAPLLHLATIEADTNAVGWLLKKGADPTLKDTEGPSVLYYAVSYVWSTNASRAPLMEMLLKAGADPDAGEGKVNSAVFLAAMLQDEQALRLLLPHSRRRNDTNRSGSTALHYAESPEVFRLLVDAGWDPNLKNKNGQTPAEMIASRSKR